MLHGKNFINGEWVDSPEAFVSPDMNKKSFAQATAKQIDLACESARAVFRAYSWLDGSKRAEFLGKIADEIDLLGEEITEIGMVETGLPETRLNGERDRTTGQLKMFAELIEQNEHLDIRVVQELPNRQPSPRPDIRLTHRAIGPVAVFGASNFPLAFSTAGGDTASALAAGCPVIVKGHPAHAGTAELVCQAIERAIGKCSMPAAVFQMVQGAGQDVGTALVNHPEISAVGFTGSLLGGRALHDQCHARPRPIPFYGELGSINPVFCLPAAMESRGMEIGEGWATSLTMGAGQFCTNPGIVLGVRGEAFSALQTSAVKALRNIPAQKMLTDKIHDAYQNKVTAFSEAMEELTGLGLCDERRKAFPAVFRVDADIWMTRPELRHEVFGAAGIFVECIDMAEMLEAAEQLEGQLTATIHGDDEDLNDARDLLVVLEEKAGRLLYNGFPTGVEVCSAMTHGGPYPASTDVRTTSVGTLAITRWLRPISYQSFPKSLLHREIT